MTVPSKLYVLISLWPGPLTCKCHFWWWIYYDPISFLYEFQIDISTNSREIKYRNMGIGLLHVKRRTRKNYVKWRPIVTKFGTLIENMSRTRLHVYHIVTIFVVDLMRNSNFGIRVLHVNVKYWRIFCDVIYLLAQVCIASSNRVSQEVSMKQIEIFLWLSCCDMTVPSKSNDLKPWRSIFCNELSATL